MNPKSPMAPNGIGLKTGRIVGADEKLTLVRTIHLLDHGTDGPITSFVLISRAMELCAKRASEGRPQDEEIIGNALYHALKNFNLLRDES